MSALEPDNQPTSATGSLGGSLNQTMSAPGQLLLERQIRENLDVYRELTREFGFGFRFGDMTCFDHTTQEIVIGVSQLMSLGIKDIDAFHFAVLHEIKHYQDLARDPVSYQRLISKGTREDGLGDLYFGLYNCTEDITVNQRNRYDSALFRSADGFGYSDLVTNTYRKNLFAERDFSKLDPMSGRLQRLLCEQYADYILNLGMGVAGDLKVSAEVREVIERPITIYGKQYTLSEFIETVLKPAPKSETAQIGNSLKARIDLVEEFLEPRFEELLQKDKDREGINSLQSRTLTLGAPNGSSKGDFEGAAKYIIDKKGEERKTPTQRNADNLKKQREELAAKAGLSPEESKDFINRLKRLDPIITDLRDFWLSIPQYSIETELIYDGPRKVGIKPNIPELARQALGISIGDPNLRFMEKQIEVDSFFSSPQRIRVHLVVDASSSMKDHMNKVADLAVALAASFHSANATADIENLEFNCEAEFITFGSTAQHVVKLTPRISLTDIMSAYKSFFDYQGETRDHLAFTLIKEHLNPDDFVLRQSGELFDFVLVITDGEPTVQGIDKETLKTMSVNGITALEESGLVVRAFGIGEIPVFDQIWNGDGVTRGSQVASAQQLLSATQDLFRDELARRYPGLNTEEP